MGGGVTLFLSHLLTTEVDLINFNSKYYCDNKKFIINNLKKYYKGSVLFCPVIQITIFSLVLRIVRLLSYLIPTGSIPTFFFNENNYNYISWKDPKYQKYIFEDSYPHNKNGLSYGGNIQFITLNSILHLSEINQSILSKTIFPWIIFHDREDKSVSFNGSIQFFNLSQSKKKSIIEMQGSLHDIISNQVEKSAKKSLEWVQSQLIQ